MHAMIVMVVMVVLVRKAEKKTKKCSINLSRNLQKLRFRSENAEFIFHQVILLRKNKVKHQGEIFFRRRRHHHRH